MSVDIWTLDLGCEHIRYLLIELSQQGISNKRISGNVNT